MAHGSGSLTKQYHHRRPSWRVAWRRGVLLGSVAALHLAIVALMLRPVPPYRQAHAVAQGDDSALQVRLLLPPLLPVRPASSSPPPAKARSVVHRSVAIAPPAAVSTNVVVTAPPPATIPGDYRSAAFGAQDAPWTPRLRLPGSATAPRTSLQLRDSPSMRELVRTMTTASRCKYERMKMQRSTTQFVTRQLTERALDADGCGPPASHGAADATIEAISRSTLFGH